MVKGDRFVEGSSRCCEAHMFLSAASLEQLDPALLAFVKCHVTSSVKWEVLRVLASREGAWVSPEDLARSSHRQPGELSEAIADLAADDVVEIRPSVTPEGVGYRLVADEPTSVVLHRLIEAATHNRELREIIAAQLQHVRQQAMAVGTIAAA
jgi:hypothetical protein